MESASPSDDNVAAAEDTDMSVDEGQDPTVLLLQQRWNELSKNQNLDADTVAELKKLCSNKKFLGASEDRQLGLLEITYDLTDDQAKSALELILGRSVHTSGDTNGRGAKIVDGLETDLSHTMDFDAFSNRITKLFEWHTNAALQTKYLAPYFALVQSSGMGKTKLFLELRNQTKNSDIQCMTILCVDAGLPKDVEWRFYNHVLDIDVKPVGRALVETVWKKMDIILKDCKCTKIVLLFDEAQGLMRGTDVYGKGSLVFRAIRWWLRQKRTKSVVASFAGTSAKLSNFFPPDPPNVGGVSRNADIQYVNYNDKDEKDDKKLYPPFFELNTIGCLRGEIAEPGFPQSLMYGRPLFAYYNQQKTMDTTKQLDFAKRLVLSHIEDYAERLPSCFSVLGARVHMGAVNSFDTLSTLVSSGYACLVDFQQQESDKSTPVARLTFMPDPLCATLAMRFMDDKWNDSVVMGRCRKFWVEQARKAFSTNLCLPEKGDAGEIFAALYMLFCGDILRKEANTSLATFSVSLDEWFKLLKNGGRRALSSSLPSINERVDGIAVLTENLISKVESPSSKEDAEINPGISTATRSSAKRQKGSQDAQTVCTVSFVQICRNDFRANSFCKESVLKHRFLAGLATYTYKNCKAIDIAASIRVVRNSQPTYHPLLISVKNWAKVTKGDVVGWLSSIMALLREMRQFESSSPPPSAVCLVILLGCNNPPQMNGDNLDSESLERFPSEDVYRLVLVPKDDDFGVSEAIGQLGVASERPEIYSSHGFIASEDSPDNLLRSNSVNENHVSELFNAIKLAESKQNVA